jgi:hypothetical protein
MSSIIEKNPVNSKQVASDGIEYEWLGRNWIATQTHRIAKKAISKELDFEILLGRTSLTPKERKEIMTKANLKDFPDSPSGDKPGTRARSKNGKFYTWLGFNWIEDGTNKLSTKRVRDELGKKNKPKNPVDRVRALAMNQDFERHSRESLNWYSKQISKFRNVNAKTFMEDNAEDLKSNTFYGHMYLYAYDPKHKATLPYYDQWPLIFIIEEKKDGWLGINLHYLPPKLRGSLLLKLLEFKSSKKINDKTRLLMTYKLLKDAAKFKAFQPCLKRYLETHTRSKFMKIRPEEWEMAIFLPLQNFKKASTRKVWSDSRRTMNG